MTELNAKTFKEFMVEHNLTVSKAVNVFMRMAAIHKRRLDVISKTFENAPDNPVLLDFITQEDKARQDAIQQAKWTAQVEKAQGWPFLEHGDDYVNALMIKYEGNLEKCNEEEKLTVKWIELLDNQRRFLDETVRPANIERRRTA